MRLILVVMMVLAMTTAAWAAADPTEEPGTTMIECPDCGTVGICMSCYGLDENCEVCGGTFVCATCGGAGYIQSPSHFYNTPLSLLPPVIAIALALLTKEVYSSLFIGILMGGLLYSNFQFEGTLLHVFEDGIVASLSDSYNVGILIFLVILGAMVCMMNKAGGSAAFGRWAQKNIKTRVGAQLASILLGCLIFIDDYFNCLTVGTVMKPLTDSYRVSREKLAYIIDSTAAPMCIIAPVSSWAAAVGSSLKSTGAFQSDFQAFVSTIPYNFYAIFCLLLVLYLSWTNRDFGPMKKAEENALLKSVEDKGSGATVEKPKHAQSDKGTIWDMLLPLIALIVFAVLALLYDGGYWGKDAAYHTVAAALGNCSASKALVWASFGALGVAFIMYIPRRVVSFHNFMEGTIEGMKLMLPANVILVLAWTLSGVCRDLLTTQTFVQGMVSSGSGLDLFLPAAIFLVAAFLSFSTGTAWGTFGILIPIAVPVAAAVDPSLTIVCLSATLAGSVFGDHCSPISDTTILSSAGSGCSHISHVSTQLPYAWFVACCCFVGYVAAGFSKGSWIISFGATAVCFVGFLAFMWNRSFNVRAFAKNIHSPINIG